MTVLSHQALKALIMGKKPMIEFGNFSEDLVQSAGIDCPLGRRAYRMRASSVPRRGEIVQDLLSDSPYDWDLKDEGSFLEKGISYIIPLDISLSLSEGFYAVFSPKSSVGRNDVFVRVLCDNWNRFDVVSRGYSGPLYVEVTPLSYPVRISPGLSLTQMRIRDEEERLSNTELERLHAEHGIVRDQDGIPLPHRDLEVRQDGVFFHIDLATSVVGFEAIAHPEAELNLAKVDTYNPRDFWRPLWGTERKTCVLSPERFYLLKTRERVIIPPDTCAWMQPYDVAAGEFRSHYAGFFDNGFGGEFGTTGVLEVRVRDVPFRLYDGQPVCHMVFERTDEVPKKLYGKSLGSNYTEGGPSLAKHFRDRYLAWEENYWK